MGVKGWERKVVRWNWKGNALGHMIVIKKLFCAEIDSKLMNF